MDGLVAGQFGMKRCGKQVALLNQHRQAVGAAENAHPVAQPADDGSTDENHFDGMAAEFRTFAGADGAIDLPSVGVPLHSNIQQTEMFLRRRENFLCQENRPSAGPENRFAFTRKVADARSHAFGLEEFEHSGAFASGHDEAVNLLKFAGVLDEAPRDADAVQHFGVQRKVTLDSENTHRAIFVAVLRHE